MTYNARMQWVSQRILESFEPSVSQSDVSEFLASPSIKKLWDELLAGKELSKIFVHFQADVSNFMKNDISIYTYIFIIIIIIIMIMIDDDA
jgi:hypothetical protein